MCPSLYSFKVREHGTEEWLDTFALVTECTAEKFCNTTGAFDNLEGWSNTYVNFEMREGAEVEIRITKLSEEGLKGDIEKAVVHPEKAARECFIENGRAHVVIGSTGLFTVDIDGQMDDQDTGRLPPDGRDQYRDALKGGAPGCVKVGENFAFCLHSAGRRTQLFHLIYT